MEEALRYISQPTMGYDGQTDIYEFVQKQASEQAVRTALATCIRIARTALEKEVGYGVKGIN